MFIHLLQHIENACCFAFQIHMIHLDRVPLSAHLPWDHVRYLTLHLIFGKQPFSAVSAGREKNSRRESESL